MLHLDLIAGFWFAIALRITIGISVGSLLVVAFLRRFRMMPAEARYGLWMVVILQGLFWFHIPVHVPARPSLDGTRAGGRETSPSMEHDSIVAPTGVRTGREQSADGTLSLIDMVTGESHLPSAERSSDRPVAGIGPLPTQGGARWPLLPVWPKAALALAWGLGVAGLTLLAILRSRGFHRKVMRSARPASNGLEKTARELARRHEIRWSRGLRVLESDDCGVPMVVGFLRPTIVFPSGLSGLSREQLESILAHELAHLRRADNVFAALSLCSCLLNFFNPAVWWAERCLAMAREESADRWVTRMAGYPPKLYAEALLAVATSVSGTRVGWLAVSGKPSQLRQRVIAVLKPASASAPSSVWPARIFSIAIAAAVLISLVSVRESPIALAQSDAAPKAPFADVPSAADDSSFLEPGSDGSADAALPVREGADGLSDASRQAANETQPFRFFDSFDGKLELDWEVIQPDPTRVSLEKRPGYLTITSQRGGLRYRAGNNIHTIPNPLQEGGDFVVTTCLEGFHPEVPYQQAGPVIYDDHDNYFKAIIARNDQRVILGCSWERRSVFGGRDLDATGIAWNRLWIRIIKRGSAYESSYSLDGKKYTMIAERFWGDGAPQRIGLAVMNEQATSAPMDAAFDSFEVRSLTDEEKNDPLYLERRKLHGIWEVVSSRLGGRLLEQTRLSRFEFDGNVLAFWKQDQLVKSRYTLHPESEPKGLVLSGPGRELWANHTLAFERDGVPTNASYSIEQDRLLICMPPGPDAPAPAELETKEGDGRLLVELRRFSEVEIAAIRRCLRSGKWYVNWLDLDDDEQLTVEEFVSDWPTDQAVQQATEVFQIVDQDGDGKMTAEEYDTKPMKAVFLLRDLNADGMLSPNEFAFEPVQSAPLARIRRIFELADQDNDGAMSIEEHANRPAESWFVKFDTNDDDRLSLREYEGGNPALVRSGGAQGAFAAIDRNGDGGLSVDEYAGRLQGTLLTKQDANGDEN